MDYIDGVDFEKFSANFNDSEKFAFAKRLREITDKMNKPCEPFNGIDIINDNGRYRRWDKYPEPLKTERLAYIKSRHYGEFVFVHGDLCLDNILLTPQGELYIIDFADAVLAPKIYEHALMPYSFEFDPALIRGYFADYDAGEFMEMCFDGLLIHDFGGSIVEDIAGEADKFQSLEDLREKLKQKFCNALI
jgi:thiamine kinase-like enzyme